MRDCLILVLFFPFYVTAGMDTELERMNFFPNSDAYLNLGWQLQNTKISTPKSSVNTKEVDNYSNVLQINYAQKIHPQVFFGISGAFEATSENVASYGIPLKRRIRNSGIKEPFVYILTRLRDQTKNHGLIDFHLAYSDAWGARSIGNNKGHNYRGKNILVASLSHGKWEEEWEFKTSFSFTYNDEGEEQNSFENQTYYIKSSIDYNFMFTVQYRMNQKLYPYGGIGIIYNGTEVVQGRDGDQRELQAGTGSIFTAGIKNVLNDWALIALSASLVRDQYFVKGLEVNLDGQRQVGTISLSFKHAF